MHAEETVVDDRGQGEVVEHVSTVPPHVERTILSQTFIIEAIDLSDLPAFMVASDKRDKIGIADLISEEQEEGFDAVEASVDEISDEEVADTGDVSSVLE